MELKPSKKVTFNLEKDEYIGQIATFKCDEILILLNQKLSGDITIGDVRTGKKKGERIIAYNIKNGNSKEIITSQQILNSKYYKHIEDQYNYYHKDDLYPQVVLELIEIKRYPFINIKSKYHMDRKLKYDAIKKEYFMKNPVFLEEKDESKYHISFYKNYTDLQIDHNDYVLRCEGNRQIEIEHKNQTKKNIIKLSRNKIKRDHSGTVKEIFADPKKSFILVDNYIQLDKNKEQRELRVYDITTGKLIKDFVGDIEKICPEIRNKQGAGHTKAAHLRSVIFGKRYNFMLLIFGIAAILCDLKSLQVSPTYVYRCPFTNFLCLSSDEKKIIVYDEWKSKEILLFDNPLAKVEDPDEPERIEYLHTKSPKAYGEKEFFINIVGKKIKVDKSFLFS